MLLKVAINGARTPAEHRIIPVTPTRQAEEAAAAVAAGAGAVHVHVCGPDGRESLAPEDIAGTLETIRAACPGTPIGVSTGAWIVQDVSRRLSIIKDWEILPDFASVNIHEEGALHIIRLLLNKGIGVEAGIWNAKAAATLLRSGLTDECLRILIEPAEEGGSAKANLEEIEATMGHVGYSRLLHGFGGSAWEFIKLAAERNYDTRIGFEDTLTLPDGSLAKNNAALVAVALRIISSLDISGLSG